MTKTEPSVPEDSQERIYKAAALLFAQKGYAGASIRDISKAVGLSVSTIQYHVGNKETLYNEILRRTYILEHNLLSPLLEDVDETAIHNLDALLALLNQFFEVFVKRIVDEPETFRLWDYHFLDESDELFKLEGEFSLPFYQMALNLLMRARDAGTISLDDETLKMVVTSVSWMLHGYFNGRKNNWGDPTYDRYQPVHVESFKLFLKQYIERILLSTNDLFSISNLL